MAGDLRLSTPMLKFGKCHDVVKQVDVMAILSRFDYVWIHKLIWLFSLTTTFSYFSHQLQNWTSKTSLKFGVKERPTITYQPYPGICIICTSVTAVFYTCFSFGIKNPISCQGSTFTQLRSLNGILLLTDDTKISKSSFDTKQSVVNKGSQYTLVWQALCQRWRKA